MNYPSVSGRPSIIHAHIESKANSTYTIMLSLYIGGFRLESSHARGTWSIIHYRAIRPAHRGNAMLTLDRIKWNVLHGIYCNRSEVLERLQPFTGAEVVAFLCDAEVWETLSDLPASNPDA